MRDGRCQRGVDAANVELTTRGGNDARERGDVDRTLAEGLIYQKGGRWNIQRPPYNGRIAKAGAGIAASAF